MDLNALFPLLLGKGDFGDKSKLFSLLAGGKQPEDVLSSLGGSDMSALLNVMKNSQKTRSQTPAGLGAITSFAPADILGTLVKLLNAV